MKAPRHAWPGSADGDVDPLRGQVDLHRRQPDRPLYAPPHRAADRGVLSSQPPRARATAGSECGRRPCRHLGYPAPPPSQSRTFLPGLPNEFCLTAAGPPSPPGVFMPDGPGVLLAPSEPGKWDGVHRIPRCRHRWWIADAAMAWSAIQYLFHGRGRPPSAAVYLPEWVICRRRGIGSLQLCRPRYDPARCRTAMPSRGDDHVPRPRRRGVLLSRQASAAGGSL